MEREEDEEGEEGCCSRPKAAEIPGGNFWGSSPPHPWIPGEIPGPADPAGAGAGELRISVRGRGADGAREVPGMGMGIQGSTEGDPGIHGRDPGFLRLRRERFAQDSGNSVPHPLRKRIWRP